MYKLNQSTTSITRTSDGAHIPTDPANKDYAGYLEWLAGGNFALPADPVDLVTPARAQRDSLIAAVSWKYERHARELRLSLKPTDDLTALDTYMQSLADLTKQVGFPESITWPVAP